MSVQLLICKFAVFPFFYFILTDGLRDLHGLLAHSLSRPTSSPRSGTDAEVENTMS